MRRDAEALARENLAKAREAAEAKARADEEERQRRAAEEALSRALGAGDDDNGPDEPPDLVKEGFSPGAAKIGEESYWEGRKNGLSKRCAKAAARAAARAADAMGRRVANLGAVLAKGEVPDWSGVQQQALAAGRAAGLRCMKDSGHGGFGGAGAGRKDGVGEASLPCTPLG